MTWTPVSGIAPQYSTANNELAGDYYLKFYASGTTTPISMATDTTGTTQLAKCALSADGYPITNPLDDSTKFIPHIDQNYRVVLFINESDADSNNTSAAAFNIDGLEPQIAPLADATNVNIRNTDLQTQDDYDRSPLFVDGEDFTAGAGPHVITVPTGWTPSDADVRFYKVASNGVITDLTPTSTDATTFTLAETLLSTDTIFIGDDNFRNQFDGDPQSIRERIDVYQKSDVYTQTEVNEEIDTRPVPVASGFNGYSRIYLKSISAPSFSLTNLTQATWDSVGKTGSGASYIWPSLDTIPSDAKMVRLKVRLSGQLPSSTSSIREVSASFRKNSTESLVTQVQFNLAPKNAPDTVFFFDSYVIDVAINDGVFFDAQWTFINLTLSSIEVDFVGYGI